MLRVAGLSPCAVRIQDKPLDVSGWTPTSYVHSGVVVKLLDLLASDPPQSAMGFGFAKSKHTVAFLLQRRTCVFSDSMLCDVMWHARLSSEVNSSVPGLAFGLVPNEALSLEPKTRNGCLEAGRAL